ncbi:MAG: hypothetical protein D6719_00690 [Candidatus Dadabacteria bacterium]|nr:MAG: hypothetical protein D6719_00690 [Candidatus Dadabacteria bacterium]
MQLEISLDLIAALLTAVLLVRLVFSYHRLSSGRNLGDSQRDFGSCVFSTKRSLMGQQVNPRRATALH